MTGMLVLVVGRRPQFLSSWASESFLSVSQHGSWLPSIVIHPRNNAEAIMHFMA